MIPPRLLMLFLALLAVALWGGPGGASPSGFAEVLGGAVRLSESNIAVLNVGKRAVARIFFPPPAKTAPILGPERTGPAHRLLRQLYASGQAAGNHGDLYDNRDRGHSRLPAGAHPQLTHILYDKALREVGADYDLALEL